MKASLLVLSLALSATALFAQETQVTSGSYSSISTYPTLPNPIPDKLVALCWETHFRSNPTLTGPEKVKLKKGQNLVVTIQAPAQVSGRFSSNFAFINSIIYPSRYSEKPCKSDDDVLMQDNNIENPSTGIAFRSDSVRFSTSRQKPIVLNYQTGQSSGTRLIYFNITSVVPTEKASYDDMNIYVTVE